MQVGDFEEKQDMPASRPQQGLYWPLLYGTTHPGQGRRQNIRYGISKTYLYTYNHVRLSLKMLLPKFCGNPYVIESLQHLMRDQMASSLLPMFRSLVDESGLRYLLLG